MIDKMDLSNKAIMLRKELGEDEASPIDIFSLAQSIEKLTLIFYPAGERISGICYKGKASNVIIINSDMSIGRQRFSLAHELYHLYFDEKLGTTVSMISIGDGDENEKKADQFASYFLIPQASLYSIIQNYKNKFNSDTLSLEEVIRLEQYFGVSHKAMLFRLFEEKVITKSQFNEMQVNIINRAARLGYDNSLYKPSEENKKIKVLGHYVTQVEKLLEDDIISNGKYEELLLDAFRDDIVYGNETDGGDIVD